MSSKTSTYRIFQWSIATFFISTLLAVAMLFVSSAFAMEIPALWYLTYLFVVIIIVWGIGCWLCSENLRKKDSSKWKLERRRKCSNEQLRAYGSTFIRWKYGVVGVLLLVGGASLWGVYYLKTQVELSRLHGRLYPASDPLPSVCKDAIDEGALAVFLGHFVAVTHSFPHTVLQVRGKDTIVIDKDEDGILAVTFVIRSEDNRVIAEFTQGEFTINPNNIFKWYRRDRHSLEIIDQFGESVLNMRFVNPRAMWIDAALPGRDILKGSISFAEGAGMCLVDNSVSIAIN